MNIIKIQIVPEPSTIVRWNNVLCNSLYYSTVAMIYCR